MFTNNLGQGMSVPEHISRFALFVIIFSLPTIQSAKHSTVQDITRIIHRSNRLCSCQLLIGFAAIHLSGLMKIKQYHKIDHCIFEICK